MPLLGDLIRYSIENKRRKKEREAFLALFNEKDQPFAGKKISELAAILGGVGQNMPIPEHMGGNALPFNMNPILSPGQQQQLATPGVIDAKNAKLAKAKALIRSGYEPGEEAGVQMLLPQAGKQHAPMQVAPGNAIVDPNTGGIIYQAPPNEQDPNKVITLAPGAKAYDYDGRVIASNDGKEDEVGVIAIDPIDGKRRFFRRSYAIDERLEAPEPSPGVTVNTGDMGKPTPAMRTDLQKNISKANVTMDRLESVRSQWNPNWSYIETQGWQFVKGAIDKSKLLSSTVGKAISEESWKDFSAYKAWDRDMQSTINTHIHDMTGAQMSVNEVKRLLLEMATKSDGPVAYKAKIDATIAMLGSAKKEWERMLNTSVANGEMTIEEAQTTLDEIIVENLKMIAGEGGEEQPDWVEPVE